MKLGRTCAAAALLGAAALPLVAPVSWADDPGAAPAVAQQRPESRPEPTSTPGARPAEPTQAVPQSTPGARPAEQSPQEPQVRQRPVGAPETGGGPVESGFDAAVLGGAAAAVAIAGGGVAMVLRRRRAGAN
ncbi:hypothetical protein [Saccharopolyspora pogona]|uniref:hypothetical protein n=1 Tax=Saccharopolyspora pogona TaxID=333966 RepID=UPI001CC237F4|nr:hypothetical protein [Saccharopolyspora pogona]